MTDEVGAAVANYVAAWELLSAVLPSGSVERDGSVVLAATGSPIAVFNQVFVVGDGDPDAVFMTARTFFTERGNLPFIVRTPEDRFAPFLERAPDHGLQDGGTSPLMVLNPLRDFTMSARPPDVTIDVVDDAHGLTFHRAVVAGGFGAPQALVDNLLVDALLDCEWFRAFVCNVDGIPVATAALIEAGGVAGVYNVATLPAFRRRGLGELATAAATLEGARRGHVLATLQASEMGRPIYERMGFRLVQTWRHVTT